MDVEQRLKVVEDENEVLRERIAELEKELGITYQSPIEFGLTTKESRLLGILLKRELVRKETAMLAMYTDATEDKVAEIKIVDVFIFKIRRKLKPFNIEIKTIWGQGYYMEEESKQIVKDMMVDRKSAA